MRSPRGGSIAGFGARGVNWVVTLGVALVSSLLGDFSAWAAPVACSGVATVADWAALTNGCANPDVILTLINSTLPKTTGFAAASILRPALAPVNVVALNFGGLTAGTYTVEYDIQIATVDTAFGSVSSDTSVVLLGIGAINMVTSIYDGQGNLVSGPLTSINGVPVGSSALPLGLTFLDVREAFIVPFGGILVDAANAYTQLNVPPLADPILATAVTAPGSLVLLGLGLVGVGLLRRKKAP